MWTRAAGASGRDCRSGFAAHGLTAATQLGDDGAPARAAHKLDRGSHLRRHAPLSTGAAAVEPLGLVRTETAQWALGRRAPVRVHRVDVGEDYEQLGAQVARENGGRQ